MAPRDRRRNSPGGPAGASALVLKLAIVGTCMLMALVLAPAPGTDAATPRVVVSAGSALGLAGGTSVPVSISLKSLDGAQAVAVNFDFTYDASRLSVGDVSIGAAASSVGKSISWSQPATNRIRVVVVGLNQDAIPNGAVAVVRFDVQAGARPKAAPLVLTGVAVSDPTTLPIAKTVVNGAFRVVTRLR